MKAPVAFVLVVLFFCCASANRFNANRFDASRFNAHRNTISLPLIGGSKTFSDSVMHQVLEYGPPVDIIVRIETRRFKTSAMDTCNDMRTSLWVGVNLPKDESQGNQALLTVVRVDNILNPSGNETGFTRCFKEKMLKDIAGWPEELSISLKSFDTKVRVPANPNHDCYQVLIDLRGAVPMEPTNSSVPRQVFVVTHDERGKPFPITAKILALNKMRNPTFKFLEFTIAEMIDAVEQFLGAEGRKLVESLQAVAYQTDVFRYTMMKELGGVYMDSKLWTMRPLEKILPRDDADMFVWDIMERGIQCAFLIARKNDPLVTAALEIALNNIRERNYGASSLGLTGPAVAIKAYRSLPSSVRNRYQGWLQSDIKGNQICDKKRQPWIIYHNAAYRSFMSTLDACHYNLLYQMSAVFFEKDCKTLKQTMSL